MSWRRQQRRPSSQSRGFESVLQTRCCDPFRCGDKSRKSHVESSKLDRRPTDPSRAFNLPSLTHHSMMPEPSLPSTRGLKLSVPKKFGTSRIVSTFPTCLFGSTQHFWFLTLMRSRTFWTSGVAFATSLTVPSRCLPRIPPVDSAPFARSEPAPDQTRAWQRPHSPFQRTLHSESVRRMPSGASLRTSIAIVPALPRARS